MDDLLRLLALFALPVVAALLRRRWPAEREPDCDPESARR
jgi:hypothetical protein